MGRSCIYSGAEILIKIVDSQQSIVETRFPDRGDAHTSGRPNELGPCRLVIQRFGHTFM